ncbi:AbiH family protein [Mesorhizobium sp. M00.F.Ca.ET.217.01.1.1]|uniref:AbiH family protein n=1 Tax=Mesorhizobium sp. M00.F.Ca.ET.217.01.1.1 TaxID=2500529 RepID=UPI000FD81D6A|nr:AbiH family protein [Mesorhizobium sp. M00.F.Ca.ET.217.01.1.1]TGQ13587.1 hypothetical protein EN860_030615 [Mesorhizobium sp. M00.F.Ca.ET.217.01.1.1]TGV85451.1 hypothetical protein EN801_029320 [Mesorhizobium sp. M00.F.Ca.ET.158.01.1.1]
MGTLIDDVSGFLVNYGADEWSDSHHHDYQYEISQAMEAVSVRMRERFGDWVRQLAVPDPSTTAAKRLPLDLTAKFLNFNYTPSLQALCDVALGRLR